MSCPFCKIRKESSGKKIYVTASDIPDGSCPDCGAYLDRGQMKIAVNSYSDIYKGVVRTIEDVVQQVNHVLDYLDVDTAEIDGEAPRIRLTTSEIIRNVFMPYAGGTSVCNFKNAIGISDDNVEFELNVEPSEY